MKRGDKARLLELALAHHLCLRNRVFFQVSLRKEPSYIPAGWAEALHLDAAAFPLQRQSSGIPFRVHGYEIKSCRSDFVTDHKWQSYPPRVDAFSFVSFPDVIRKGELPKGVGLLELQVTTAIPHWNAGRPALRLVEAEGVRWNHVDDLARFDLMYGLAICERRYLKALQRQYDKEMKRLVNEYLRN